MLVYHSFPRPGSSVTHKEGFQFPVLRENYADKTVGCSAEKNYAPITAINGLFKLPDIAASTVKPIGHAPFCNAKGAAQCPMSLVTCASHMRYQLLLLVNAKAMSSITVLTAIASVDRMSPRGIFHAIFVKKFSAGNRKPYRHKGVIRPRNRRFTGACRRLYNTRNNYAVSFFTFVRNIRYNSPLEREVRYYKRVAF